jgi:serine/threonine protein kinase
MNVARQIAQVLHAPPLILPAPLIFEGMSYLHAKGIVVQCLTSRNVYLECKVKISMLDYGTTLPGGGASSMMVNAVPLHRGQLDYYSPELMSSLCLQPPMMLTIGAPCTCQSDIYAYGYN